MLVRRCLQSARPSRLVAFASTQASEPTATQSPRLEALRAQLAQDSANANAPTLSVATTTHTKASASSANRKKRRKGLPKPKWLKGHAISASSPYHGIRQTVRDLGLATVCEEAKCPNIGECWSGNAKDGVGATATIMIMGDTCTRGCRFCAVKTLAQPPPLDPEEPTKVADALARFGALDYVVLTSVDRDDVADQGAGHFRAVVQELAIRRPDDLLIEALTPDFSGNLDGLKAVATSGLHVLAHNIETVRELTPRVRDRRAGYDQSLQVLRNAKRVVREAMDNNTDGNNNKINPILTKTSIMLGLGETSDQIRQTLEDLRAADVDVVTLGQYLQPSPRHLKVQRYVPPDEFREWETVCHAMGFGAVASGPMVRSSYRAAEVYRQQFGNHKDAAAAATA